MIEKTVELKCGCIESYDLCPIAKKIYKSAPMGSGLKKRLKMWNKLHKHWNDNK
jgi:hypothetical protein